MAMKPARTWDIFCRVVDNYGDIGVCWRLARQLAAARRRRVRLWVDDLAVFARIDGGIAPARALQVRRGVEIHSWRESFPAAETGEPADVIIEAFACDVPEPYVAAMARRVPRPVWINLEYLSAEEWVGGCHGLPSPHPRLPLVKYFFFPGFGAGTGGLLLERGLLARRRRFQCSAVAQRVFWRGLGMAPARAGEIRVSLFSYGNWAIPELLSAWAQSPAKVVCLVPESAVAAQACDFVGMPDRCAGAVGSKGSLEVRVFPFLPQDRYDRLLWACDCNFVRGEDSFVRAQWAARPFVWQAYPQEHGAHWPKLSAFLDRYCAGWSSEPAQVLRDFWNAWNRGAGAGEAWHTFWMQRQALAAHGGDWAARLGSQAHLADALVEFCEDRIK
jgi:uncharacterized repeat protein (TIGR03837 family)